MSEPCRRLSSTWVRDPEAAPSTKCARKVGIRSSDVAPGSRRLARDPARKLRGLVAQCLVARHHAVEVEALALVAAHALEVEAPALVVGQGHEVVALELAAAHALEVEALAPVVEQGREVVALELAAAHALVVEQGREVVAPMPLRLRRSPTW